MLNMKFNFFLLVSLFQFNSACNQAKNKDIVSNHKDTLYQHKDTLNLTANIKYSPVDFSSAENMSEYSVLTGSVFFTYKLDISKANPYGIARVYMFYEKGSYAWKQESVRKFAKDTLVDVNYSLEIANERLLKQDKKRLKEFNYYAFFIDKKYLTKGVADYNMTYHYPTPNSNIEVILYQKLASEERWIEIDRRVFKTDEYGGYDWTWIENFINEKKKQFK